MASHTLRQVQKKLSTWNKHLKVCLFLGASDWVSKAVQLSHAMHWLKKNPRSLQEIFTILSISTSTKSAMAALVDSKVSAFECGNGES